MQGQLINHAPGVHNLHPLGLECLCQQPCPGAIHPAAHPSWVSTIVQAQLLRHPLELCAAWHPFARLAEPVSVARSYLLCREH